MKQLKLTLSYKGTHFFGWQKTQTEESSHPTIEGCVQKAILQIMQESLTLEGASRTDAGVHARAQIATCLVREDFPTSELALSRLKRGINALLPFDIRVLYIEEVPLSFHPSLDAIGKEYEYHVTLGKVQLPFQRELSWHFPYSLDLGAIEAAIHHFIGEKDFSAFSNQKERLSCSTSHNPICHITHFNFEIKNNHSLCFVIRGNRFLYKMVRNLVGSCIYVGCGKLSCQEIPGILLGKDRTKAGITAPAHGLFLKKVLYET